MAGDGIEDVVVACNSTKKIRNISNGVNAFEAPGGTICAKASMLLQVRVLLVHYVTTGSSLLFCTKIKLLLVVQHFNMHMHIIHC